MAFEIIKLTYLLNLQKLALKYPSATAKGCRALLSTHFIESRFLASSNYSKSQLTVTNARNTAASLQPPKLFVFFAPLNPDLPSPAIWLKLWLTGTGAHCCGETVRMLLMVYISRVGTQWRH